ncbi:MAG: low molecular weight protein-tyrosine-phosphatase [Ginsengibacter sp.]
MKILMVCLGNICRSPLAHGILEKMAADKGLNWEIDSAGTGDWHIGNPPDRRSISIAKKYGVDISSQVCRQFQPDDFAYYDRIYVMDKNNLRDVLSLSNNKEEQEKVMLFLENDIVPDPYLDDNLFDPVYHMIEERCRQILKKEENAIRN